MEMIKNGREKVVSLPQVLDYLGELIYEQNLILQFYAIVSKSRITFS